MSVSANINIPIGITVFRILLVPALAIFLSFGMLIEALTIFIAAGISDALDGFIAKRFGQTTELGRILDPVADKLLLVTSFVMLTVKGWMPRNGEEARLRNLRLQLAEEMKQAKERR